MRLTKGDIVWVDVRPGDNEHYPTVYGFGQGTVKEDNFHYNDDGYYTEHDQATLVEPLFMSDSSCWFNVPSQSVYKIDVPSQNSSTKKEVEVALELLYEATEVLDRARNMIQRILDKQT